MTGCDVVQALDAAHISPYLGDQSNHVTNGVLLRADIHTLFDLQLFDLQLFDLQLFDLQLFDLQLFDLQLFGIEPEALRLKISASLIGTCFKDLDGR